MLLDIDIVSLSVLWLDKFVQRELNKGIQIFYVSQKHPVKRDIKLLLAAHDVWDVKFSLLKLAIAKSDGSSLGG